ncbi:MAG: VOC family protein [Candidatus Saccharimonadales bacterium]
MLKDCTVVATIAVHDLDKAKAFYIDKLGLEIITEITGVMTFKSGDGLLYVYQSDTAGTNKASSATWQVDNIEAVVSELKSKDIVFESYSIEGLTENNSVYSMGNRKAAWFKDPDGNTIALSSQSN